MRTIFFMVLLIVLFSGCCKKCRGSEVTVRYEADQWGVYLPPPADYQPVLAGICESHYKPGSALKTVQCATPAPSPSLSDIEEAIERLTNDPKPDKDYKAKLKTLKADLEPVYRARFFWFSNIFRPQAKGR